VQVCLWQAFFKRSWKAEDKTNLRNNKRNIASILGESGSCQFEPIAVEMEGRGFLEAARANQSVAAMVIRGISDLIEMSDWSKQFLRYMAEADASVSLAELEGVFQVTGAEAREARTQLKRWSMILANGGRDDLHPWVRRSVRSNLQSKWEVAASPEELDRIAEWKYGV
jgi:hypothetical protein